MSEQMPEAATLEMAAAPSRAVDSLNDLRAALVAISDVADGQHVTLSRDSRHYIKASRVGDYWAVVAKNGGWWTLKQFSASSTSEYSDRTMKEYRASGSLFNFWFPAIRPINAISGRQVTTLFEEFFLGRRFTIPTEGAG